jgi:hypothetical protein
VRIDFIKGRESQPEVLAAIDEYYTQSKLVEFDTAKSFMNELKF